MKSRNFGPNIGDQTMKRKKISRMLIFFLSFFRLVSITPSLGPAWSKGGSKQDYRCGGLQFGGLQGSGHLFQVQAVALQLLSHCKYGCTAIICALQLFSHCSYCCIAIICALQLFLHGNYCCIAIVVALQLCLHCMAS